MLLLLELRSTSNASYSCASSNISWVRKIPKSQHHESWSTGTSKIMKLQNWKMENVNSKIYRLLTQFTSPTSPLPPKSNVVIGDAGTRTAHNIGSGGRGWAWWWRQKLRAYLFRQWVAANHDLIIWSSFFFHLRSPARDHLFCLSICVNMLLGMYVCMYVCMYVVCMSYVCTSVCICMCACMYALVNVCMCMYVCVYVCMR